MRFTWEAGASYAGAGVESLGLAVGFTKMIWGFKGVPLGLFAAIAIVVCNKSKIYTTKNV
jgi:hypothetical protein